MDQPRFGPRRPFEILRSALVDDLSRVRKQFEDAGWTTSLQVEDDESVGQSVVMRVWLPQPLHTQMLKAKHQSVDAIKEGILVADPTSLNPEAAGTSGKTPTIIDERSLRNELS